VASILPARSAPDLEHITKADHERFIRQALDNLWQYLPDLEGNRPEPLVVTAQNGLIAYVGIDKHLYLMNPNGTAKTPLVTDLPNLAYPAWSAGDEILAFVGDGEGGRCLYSLRMSNKVRTCLVCGFFAIWDPRWSPDNRYLVYYGQQVSGERYRAWIVSAGGGSAVELAPALDEIWSPDWIDHDSVVFSAETTEGTWHIYRVDVPQPTQPRAITPNIQCNEACKCNETDVLAAFPVLSPDTSKVAYIGGRTEGDKNSCTAYYAVYLVDPNGANPPSKIADVADSTGTGTASVSKMLWSPDNQRVGLFAGGSDRVLRLTTVQVTNGQVNPLHGRQGGGWDGIDWSPDGSLLAAGYIPGSSDPELVSADPATDNFQSLSQGGGPAWSSIPPVPPVDLRVTGIQVTQAIQRASGSEVSMIQGKRTWVRVSFQSSPHDLHNVRARLYLSRGEESLELSPANNGISAKVNGSNRNQLDDTFNFSLPLNWTTGTIGIRVEVGPDNQFYELNYGNNSFPATSDSPKQITFNPARRISLHSYRLRFTKRDGSQHVVTHAEVLDSMPFLRKVYPIAEANDGLNVVDRGELVLEGFADNYNLQTGAGWAALLRLIPCDTTGAAPDEVIRCYGWVPWTVHPQGGRFWAYADSPKGAGPVGYLNLFAHELGHTFGLWDIGPCQAIDNTGFWGDEVAQTVYITTAYNVFMNYSSACGILNGNQWVSSNHYELMQRSLLIPGATSLVFDGSSSPQYYLGVSGVITPGQAAEVISTYTISRTAGITEPSSGPYTIQLLDENEQVLLTHNFSGGLLEGDEISDGVYYDELIVRPPGSANLIIWEGAKKLTELSTTPNAPQVRLLTALDGLTVSGEVIINWTASDADGDELSYLIEYSPDNGQSWQILGLNLARPTYTLNADYLMGTVQGKIRISASDGLNTGSSVSDGFFNVDNKAPVVFIEFPQNDSRITYDTVINLVGEAFDREDGILSGNSLVWRLDGSAIIGTGAYLSYDGFSWGSHTLTLEATDSSGATSDTSVTFTYGYEWVFLPMLR
jgi:Tol biopolymer transport system component